MRVGPRGWCFAPGKQYEKGASDCYENRAATNKKQGLHGMLLISIYGGSSRGSSEERRSIFHEADVIGS